MQIGTNYFGHVLLTNLLLNTLRSSGTIEEPVRIITVSSIAHIVGKIYRKDLQLAQPNMYKPWKAYFQSKLANILFTRKLAKRLLEMKWNVKTNSLNPGAYV